MYKAHVDIIVNSGPVEDAIKAHSCDGLVI